MEEITEHLKEIFISIYNEADQGEDPGDIVDTVKRLAKEGLALLGESPTKDD